MDAVTKRRVTRWSVAALGLTLALSASAQQAATPLDAPARPAENFQKLYDEIDRINLLVKGNAMYVDLEREVMRERSLSAQLQGAEVMQMELERRARELDTLRQRIDQQMAGVGGQVQTQVEGNENLKLLITLYESLKPEEVVGMFKRLPMSVTMAIMQQMSVKKAGKILAAMDPKMAAEVSRRLIRNANVATAPKPGAPEAAESPAPAGGQP